MRRPHLAWGLLAAIVGAALGVSMFADAPEPRAGRREAAAPIEAIVTSEGALVEIYNRTLESGAPPTAGEGRHAFVVRPGDRDLVVALRVGEGAAQQQAPPRIVTPDNRSVTGCPPGDCRVEVGAPLPGVWRIAADPQAQQPVEAVVTVVRAAPAPAEELVFAEERRRPAGGAHPEWTDSFVVQPGQSRLEVSGSYGGRTTFAPAVVEIVAPDGRTVATWSGSNVRLVDVEPGVWLLRCSWGAAEYLFPTVVAYPS